jgi:tRNA-2-methylthio-N6-dimethylallyladenosine synthase
MLRNYTREEYVELTARMRRAMPGMTLSTDIIVGFPGETDDDFRQTLSLIEEIEFDWGFIFKYSPREGTPAARLECHPQELIEERQRSQRAGPGLQAARHGSQRWFELDGSI